MQNASRTRQVELATDYVLSKPVPWHEVTNTGHTTLRFLVVDEIPEIISHQVAAMPQPPNSEAAMHRGR